MDISKHQVCKRKKRGYALTTQVTAGVISSDSSPVDTPYNCENINTTDNEKCISTTYFGPTGRAVIFTRLQPLINTNLVKCMLAAEQSKIVFGVVVIEAYEALVRMKSEMPKI